MADQQPTDTIRWYDENAEALVQRYDAVASEQVHDWLINLLPEAPASVLVV